MRRGGLIGVGAAVAALLGGCAPGAGPAPATWTLQGEVTAASAVVEIGVTRVDCADGVTGELLDPVVTYEDDRILIEARAAPNGLDGAGCPENDVVAQTVELDEPVGERALVDALCLDEPYSSYVWCDGTQGVRWTPAG